MLAAAVPRTTLGRTGLSVTRLGIGGAYAETADIYAQALDSGVNYIVRSSPSRYPPRLVLSHHCRHDLIRCPCCTARTLHMPTAPEEVLTYLGPTRFWSARPSPAGRAARTSSAARLPAATVQVRGWTSRAHFRTSGSNTSTCTTCTASGGSLETPTSR